MEIKKESRYLVVTEGRPDHEQNRTYQGRERTESDLRHMVSHVQSLTGTSPIVEVIREVKKLGWSVFLCIQA